jgi:ABC-type uncharacterized transport system involved in gliding motility auxiliary subunit
MARFGVRVGSDVVIEGDPMRQIAGGGPTWIVLDGQSYDHHAVTEKLDRGQAILTLARSVSKGPEIDGLTVTELAHSTEQSWAETDLQGGEGHDAKPDEGVDIVGRVPLAVAVEVTKAEAIITETPAASTLAPPADAAAPAASAPATDGATPAPADGAAPTAEAPAIPSIPNTAAVGPASTLPKKEGGKVVVFGDADFASNQFVTAGLNQDLVLNTVAWMADEGKQISIRANESEKGKITVGVLEAFLAAMIAIIGVPGLAVVGAVGTWIKRRKM